MNLNTDSKKAFSESIRKEVIINRLVSERAHQRKWSIPNGYKTNGEKHEANSKAVLRSK
jgi:adenylate kinase family enzyme